ncbi:MAG: hypothetical protein AAFN27_07230 [Pseudomonadota bacterium]
MDSDYERFLSRGWLRFSHDSALADWVDRAIPVAETLCNDPDLVQQWLRCGGTWFAGVNIFPNDERGAIPDASVPPLSGNVIDFIVDKLGFGGIAWDPAQISVCYPGYPQPWEGESDAAFRFRRDRDAAHVDGLRRSDPGRRRSPAEGHAFILGIPLNTADPEAAPLVVYEGSHEVIRRALRERLGGIDPQDWRSEDVTEAYTAARRAAFERCPRVPVTAKPGECYLVHRLAVHGVAPWTAPEVAGAKRSIAYFRPDPDPGGSLAWWLGQP